MRNLTLYIFDRCDLHDGGMEDRCLIWRGCKTKQGYGRCTVGGNTQYAHRLAYEVFIGPIPDGHDVHHKCSMEGCCNPKHLEAVPWQTHRKMTETQGQWAKSKTHCPHGHEYTPENTWYHKAGPNRRARVCRKCGVEKTRRKRAAMRT